MGLSSSKSTTKPVFENEIKASGNALTSTYNATQPKIQQTTDTVLGLLPSLIDKQRVGNSAVNGARDWITSTLSSNGPNPYLDQMIDQTGGDTARAISANMGTRGLTGGTVMQDILARELSKNALNMRYQDYNAQQDMKARAASLAPSIAAGENIQIDPILAVADQASAPLRSAVGYSSGMGGLLGQYTNTKSSQGLGGALIGGLSNIAASFVGRGR